MAARDLCLRVILRKINFGENVRHRITPAEQILSFFQLEYRRIKFACAHNEQFGCHGRGSIDLRMNAVLGDRLLSTTKRAKQIRCNDLLAAKTAEHTLIRETYRGRDLLDAIGDISLSQIIKMFLKKMTDFGGRDKTRTCVIFNRFHKKAFDLIRQL